MIRLDPCPKGGSCHPQYSQELGHLAVEMGIWPLYEMWTEWLIRGVIPFTVSAKDQSILKIDKKPLHEGKTA